MKSLKQLLLACLLTAPGVTEPSPRIAALLAEPHIGQAEAKSNQQRLDEYRIRRASGDELLEICLRHPSWVFRDFERLPDRQDAYDLLFNQLNEASKHPEALGAWQREVARVWLRRHSNHFRSQLVAAARGGDWGDFRALLHLEPAEAERVALEFPEGNCFRLVAKLERWPADTATLVALKLLAFDDTAKPSDRYEACVTLGRGSWNGQANFMRELARLEQVGNYNLLSGWASGAPDRWRPSLEELTTTADEHTKWRAKSSLASIAPEGQSRRSLRLSEKMEILKNLAVSRSTEPGATDLEAHFLFQEVDPGSSLLRSIASEIEHAPGPLSNQLQGMIGEWNSDEVDDYILGRILDDTIQDRLLVHVHHHKENLAGAGSSRLVALLPNGGERAGLAAYLLGDMRLQRDLLSSGDEPAKQAFLAMARLERQKLPVEWITPLLDQSQMRETAVKYLLALDSPDSRRLLAKSGLVLGLSQDLLMRVAPKIEAKLRDKLRLHQEIKEIYGLSMWWHYAEYNQIYLFVRRDGTGRFEHHWQSGKTDAEELSKSRVTKLISYFEAKKVDSWEPNDSGLGIALSEFEYVHLTRQGGRRLYLGGACLEEEPYRTLVHLFLDVQGKKASISQDRGAP